MTTLGVIMIIGFGWTNYLLYRMYKVQQIRAGFRETEPSPETTRQFLGSFGVFAVTTNTEGEDSPDQRLLIQPCLFSLLAHLTSEIIEKCPVNESGQRDMSLIQIVVSRKEA